jgi:lipopolysaccharide/colanic/teichoic acid biosynthesis glycosyltransferase
MVKGHAIHSSLQPASNNSKNLIVHFITLLSCIVILSLQLTVTNLLLTNLTLSAPQFLNVLCGSLLAYALSSVTLHNLGRFPGNRPLAYLLPVVGISMIILVTVITFARLEYSRTLLLSAVISIPVIAYAELRLRQRYQKGRYAVVPFGFYKPLVELNPSKFFVLNNPSREADDIIGLIVDSNEQLSPEWQQFIAAELSKDTAVIDTVTAYESITGKSPLDHYGELATHELAPSRTYLKMKRLLESLLILTSTPVTLPIVLVIALAVKLESPGPAFFVQRRVGKGGREFKMYKIRSMHLNSVECTASATTEENDPRITRVGRLIRKSRIDEIPQFINVLKGDMALIGPRAEAVSSAAELQRAIPLFHYRHIVRPGITGWAQVTQGYAAGVEDSREKLAHDFYYVKNISAWLDLDIIFKTIRTMLTGFGAR